MRGIAIAVALLLAACSGSSDAPPPDNEDRETVFDPLTDSLDRAKDVQDVELGHKDDIDEALREAEERDDEG